MKLTSFALSLALLATSGGADEGMWTFDNLPLQALKEKYQFEPSQAWLDHLRLSTIRTGGCTASFISKNGLVLTNHHCVRQEVARLSSKERDWVKEGFVAMKPEEELKFEGANYRVLMAMVDISDRVNLATAGRKTEQNFLDARDREVESIKKELEKKEGYKYLPVYLYNGGETWLYGYKEFKDIRLVMAPEIGISSFGGDFDNFTYPRHCLDFSLLRVYENGRPYQSEHFLHLSAEPLKMGDLTFIPGHPGRTSRLQTYAQMKYDRDHGLPGNLKNAYRERELLQEYGKRGQEQAREVQTALLGISNSIKANEGFLEGLKSQVALQKIEDAEKAMHQDLARDPGLQGNAGQSWKKIEESLEARKHLLKEMTHVGTCRSDSLRKAVELVRLVRQAQLPREKRLSDYRSDSSLASLKERLEKPSPAPSGGLEKERLLFSRGMEDAFKALGNEHPFLQALLRGKKPEVVAGKALEGTKVQDAAFRKSLLAGGLQALRASKDPMIALARRIEPLLLALKSKQDDLSRIIEENAARIAKARFALYGKRMPPDATSTLRLTFGPVACYPANGTLIQPFTTFSGLIDRHLGWGGQEPDIKYSDWVLPSRWIAHLDQVNPRLPLNFCHSTDVIGGNSGSPVVNRKGELVGVVFDGNIESLAGRYYFNETVNRSVSVDVRAILESLEKVYGARHLANEIREGGSKP